MNSKERAEKSKRLRYKKSILDEINIDFISNWLWDVQNEIGEITWIISDEETLLDALDGDEEEEFEFRMMFADLEVDCERLVDLIENEYIEEHFDDFFVGLAYKNRFPYTVLGYDSFEADYFHLSSYEEDLAESEAGKRLKRLTKDEFIAAAGQCFGLVLSFLDLRYKYDYLRATFDVLKGENGAVLRMVKDIEDLYSKIFYCEGKEIDRYSPDYYRFNSLLDRLPERLWLE